MSGECFEHDIQWFGGGTDCPICEILKLADDLDNRTVYYGFEVSRLIQKIVDETTRPVIGESADAI